MMNNMKKMKGVSLGSSVYGVVDQEEVRMRFKHQSLLQDFGELEKETELMKKRLQKANRKKLTLVAEVRFLRRRYEFLIKNPPQETSLEPLIPFQNPVVHREVAAKERIYTEKDFIVSRPSKHLDLNASLLGGEEEAGMLKLDREPLRVDKKLKRCSTTKEVVPASNLNFSISRDVGNGSDRSAKRRVSWQDPVALRIPALALDSENVLSSLEQDKKNVPVIERIIRGTSHQVATKAASIIKIMADFVLLYVSLLLIEIL